MNGKITETEIAKFLADIESAKVTLTPSINPSDVYAGDVRYRASNGWEIVVFNDANEWDYIDFIKSCDGRELNFEDLDGMERIRNYSPPKEVAIALYKIPCC